MNEALVISALTVPGSITKLSSNEECIYDKIFIEIKDTFKPTNQKENGNTKNEFWDSDSDDEETNLFTKQIQKLKHKPKLHKSKKKDIEPVKNQKSVLRSK